MYPAIMNCYQHCSSSSSIYLMTARQANTFPFPQSGANSIRILQYLNTQRQSTARLHIRQSDETLSFFTDETAHVTDRINHQLISNGDGLTWLPTNGFPQSQQFYWDAYVTKIVANETDVEFSKDDDHTHVQDVERFHGRSVTLFHLTGHYHVQ